MHQSITPAECIATVQQLASFGTRHTLSTTTDPARGIGAARHWLASTLRSFGGNLHVSLDEHAAPITPRTPAGGTLVNVVATLPGVMPQATHRVYCIAHYDSINADVMNTIDDAPGANDNASGCAVVLACAKALSHARPDASIIFMLTSGEEQGLLGARAHAHKLAAATGVSQVYVLNNDTVGDPGPALLREGLPPIDTSRPLIRMFSEGLPKNMTLDTAAALRTLGGEHDSPSRQLARAISDTALSDNAVAKPWSVHRPDRFLRGGDHTPFNECGFAAVRFTSLAEDYSRQHVHPHMREGALYGDLPRFVNADYLAAVARLNCKALLTLANAPAAPANARIVAAGMENDTLVRWDASPEHDLAHYQVLWRDTDSPIWRASRNVPAGTHEARIGVSKDNAHFGVRAIDRDGNASVSSFCIAAKT